MAENAREDTLLQLLARAPANKIVVVRGQINNVWGLTRPADQTPYSAKDAISDSTSAPHIWMFPGVGRAIGVVGSIVKAIIVTSQTANLETFRLHLYNAPPTAINDNAACTDPLQANIVAYQGAINFPACQTEGSGANTAYAVDDFSVRDFVCAAGDINAYATLETPNGFTPASGQTFDILLHVYQN